MAAEPPGEEPGQSAADDLSVGARQRRLRRFWRALPSSPRCKLCNSPFRGPGGRFLRLLGKGPWPANPRYCRFCFKDLYRHRAGAEIECTLLFADVRGSTQLAEGIRPGEYRRLLDRFYETAVEVLVAHDAIVDKFVGDEVIGIFVPALTEAGHARQAVDAALALMRATGHQADAPWIPIGIGVNTGTAYVGTVGTAEHVEFTALGDAVNVTARLASAAARGEILVTRAAARAAGLAGGDLEPRRLDLKGRSDATDVVVLSVSSAGEADAS
ncbi:MAG: adenylate/guanylate cyclase domain-containing protein [Candidatus Limnocylindria bacterium]